MQIITEDQLKEQAPSVFSLTAHGKTSSQYALIPTIECVRGLKSAGFNPVMARESRCRNAENRPFAKHIIRFRHIDSCAQNGNLPEIVLVNSHDGASSYQIRAGIYRLVCSNGLIVGSDVFYRSIRHQGDVISKVVESATEIINLIPEALEIANQWKGVILSPAERLIYAESAALLKWDENEIEVSAERLLSPRRFPDSSTDLWTTFNVVQENLIRGGIRYRNSDSRRRNSTRPVNSVSENSRLNTSLWKLTEKMAALR